MRLEFDGYPSNGYPVQGPPAGESTVDTRRIPVGYRYKGAQTLAPTDDAPTLAIWTQETTVLADSFGDTASFVSQAVGGLGTSAYLAILFSGNPSTWATHALSVYYGPGTTVRAYYWTGAAWTQWGGDLQVAHLSDSWEDILADPTNQSATYLKLVLEVAAADGTQAALRCSYWLPST